MNIIKLKKGSYRWAFLQAAGSWWRLHWTLDGAVVGDGRHQWHPVRNCRWKHCQVITMSSTRKKNHQKSSKLNAFFLFGYLVIVLQACVVWCNFSYKEKHNMIIDTGHSMAAIRIFLEPWKTIWQICFGLVVLPLLLGLHQWGLLHT